MEYILMHRTKDIARIDLDEISNIASIYEVYDSKHLPVGTVQKRSSKQEGIGEMVVRKINSGKQAGFKRSIAGAWNDSVSGAS